MQPIHSLFFSFMSESLQLSKNQSLQNMIVRSIFILLFIGILPLEGLFGQDTGEPKVVATDPMRSYETQGIGNGISMNVNLNNFGIAVGAEYRKVVSPFSEIYFNTQISGLRDVSEQTLQFFGQQIIPNKYNRALVFPVMLGFRKRFFPEAVSDNFRFNLSAGVGPAFVFSYPYFSDQNNNGIRDVLFSEFGPIEETINDFFTGWSDGSWETGLSGEISVGVDLGRDFKKLNGVKFTFQFFYFADGIQMMEPFTPARQPYDTTIGMNDPRHAQIFSELFEHQKVFVTPQITFLFGKMW